MAAGCKPKPTELAPSAGFTASTAEAFAAAARSTAPERHEIVRFSWRSDDGQLQLSGSGAARIAPPDSLRADISAALGIGRATVLMMGDSVVAQPAGLVDRVLPDRFALWVTLGVMRGPSDLTTVERLEEGQRAVWRVTDARNRITVFELTDGALVTVSRSEGGRTTSQLRLTRDPNGAVRKASLTDFARSLRLEVDVTGREPSQPFARDTWQLR